MLAYPPGETYVPLPSQALWLALTDATMLAPSGNIGSGTVPLLFPPYLFKIELGGDEAITGSNGIVTTPIPLTVIAIAPEYGDEIGYAGDTAKDSLVTIPITIWTNTANTQDDVRARLLFLRDHRTNVLEYFGLTLKYGMVPGRARSPSPITGLAAFDYRWKFWYSRP